MLSDAPSWTSRRLGRTPAGRSSARRWGWAGSSSPNTCRPALYQLTRAEWVVRVGLWLVQVLAGWEEQVPGLFSGTARVPTACGLAGLETSTTCALP